MPFRSGPGSGKRAGGGRRCTACFLSAYSAPPKQRPPMALIFYHNPVRQPAKNAVLINEIGAALQTESCRFLFADFKKRGGYQRSLALSRQYGHYRQRYCGCPFSLR
ncbi:MAG: epoxyqueuosine reductase QueH [Christensenellales bacterium]